MASVRCAALRSFVVGRMRATCGATTYTLNGTASKRKATDVAGDPSTSVGSLCTGYGGLDLAVGDVLGDTRLAWVSDIEPGPSKVLAARYPNVPNLGDLTVVDWSKVEPVDVVTAGYPCQGESFRGQTERG